LNFPKIRSPNIHHLKSLIIAKSLLVGSQIICNYYIIDLKSRNFLISNHSKSLTFAPSTSETKTQSIFLDQLLDNLDNQDRYLRDKSLTQYRLLTITQNL
jgi:hypothetical protein